MTSLIIAISGVSGGNQGPQGIYQLLNKYSGPVKILPYDTLPEVVTENVERVTKIALDRLNSFDRIYLVGHSMGGAIATQAAYELDKAAPGRIKGLVLIGTQTEGLRHLKEFQIPVLFIHGKEDDYFPAWQIQSLCKKYAGPKRMIEFEGLNHDLAIIRHPSSSQYANDLAKNIFGEFNDFFFKFNAQEKREEILTKNLTLTPKPGFFERFTSCFSN